MNFDRELNYNKKIMIYFIEEIYSSKFSFFFALINCKKLMFHKLNFLRIFLLGFKIFWILRKMLT